MKKTPIQALLVLVMLSISGALAAQTVRDQNDDRPGPPSDVSHRFDSPEPEPRFEVQDGIEVWENHCDRSHEVIEAAYELSYSGDDALNTAKAKAAARAKSLSADAVIIRYQTAESDESGEPSEVKLLADSIKYKTS